MNDTNKHKIDKTEIEFSTGCFEILLNGELMENVHSFKIVSEIVEKKDGSLPKYITNYTIEIETKEE